VAGLPHEIPDDEFSFKDVRTGRSGEATQGSSLQRTQATGPPAAEPAPKAPLPLEAAATGPAPEHRVEPASAPAVTAGAEPETKPAPERAPRLAPEPGKRPASEGAPERAKEPAPDGADRKRPRKRFDETAHRPKPSPSRLARTNHSSPRHQLEAWLAVMVKSEASDLILRAGGRPSLRIDGKISFMPGRVPGPGPMQEIFVGVLGEKRLKDWQRTGSADAAIQLDGLGRFRINAYKQMGEPAMVIRRINEHAPDIDQLDLPVDELKQLALRKRGLVLVTGIAGSGKSTTLASMIEFMNRNIERHVITLEDPVELLFKERNCVISQREVGTDTTSFGDGLRHALRQSPDVILIGEVRDAETVVAALEATETGHMVMSTMHTVNAAQTLDRILGFFPAERHKQIRQRLGDNLAGVLSQRLVPRIDGGMIPACELMVSTPHVRGLITEGQTSEMARVIESGAEAGLISFNECLRGLVEAQRVDLSDALSASDRPDELLLTLRGIRGSAERVAGPQNKPGESKAHRSKPGGPESLRLAE
jgi:pilus retraction protein PilT